MNDKGAKPEQKGSVMTTISSTLVASVPFVQLPLLLDSSICTLARHEHPSYCCSHQLKVYMAVHG